MLLLRDKARRTTSRDQWCFFVRSWFGRGRVRLVVVVKWWKYWRVVRSMVGERVEEGVGFGGGNGDGEGCGNGGSWEVEGGRLKLWLVLVLVVALLEATPEKEMVSAVVLVLVLATDDD